MSDVKELLRKVASGKITPEAAELKLKIKPFEDLGYAKPDCHRALRQGAAEVIYGAGKTAEQIIGISRSLMEYGQKTVLITRLDAEKAAAVNKEIPLDYRSIGNIGIIGDMPESKTGKIVIATGGTSDMPIAEEAAVTAEVFGNNVTRLYDVGVA